jgi:proteasome lid subunit RPN8/RPN11
VSVQVELFRTTDYVGREHLPLAPLLREVFEEILGRPLPQAKFVLSLRGVDDSDPLPGHPTMVNLRPSHGYAHVSIVEHGLVIYRHPHTVREIVAEPLQRRLRETFPDVDHWGFGLTGPGLEQLPMVRPTPSVSGSWDIPAGMRRRRSSHIEELPDPEPPPGKLAALGVADPAEPSGGPLDNPGGQPVAVVLGRDTYLALMRHDFSADVEEGGFIIGHRHADSDNPGRELLEVTAFVPAESTGASMLRFTFTGESFLRLGDLVARRQRDEHILGWYHTHLFAATPEFGLSTVDVRLHMSTFRRTWQVAALLNIDDDGRVLRFYRSGGEVMAEAPYWIADSAAPGGAPPPGGARPPPEPAE